MAKTQSRVGRHARLLLMISVVRFIGTSILPGGAGAAVGCAGLSASF
jgi:hypothetical protein